MMSKFATFWYKYICLERDCHFMWPSREPETQCRRCRSFQIQERDRRLAETKYISKRREEYLQ
ncbi:MAG: hypothetical protein AB7G93_09660 [Bdellovibrionales bacterium]